MSRRQWFTQSNISSRTLFSSSSRPSKPKEDLPTSSREAEEGVEIVRAILRACRPRADAPESETGHGTCPWRVSSGGSTAQKQDPHSQESSSLLYFFISTRFEKHPQPRSDSHRTICMNFDSRERSIEFYLVINIGLSSPIVESVGMHRFIHVNEFCRVDPENICVFLSSYTFLWGSPFIKFSNMDPRKPGVR